MVTPRTSSPVNAVPSGESDHSAVLLIDAGCLPGYGQPRLGLPGHSWARGSAAVQGEALAALGAALQDALPKGWCVHASVRHGRPSIASAVERVVADGIDELVIVPTHPHFSPLTTGAIMREVYRVLQRRGQHLNVTVHTTWYDDAAYVNALAQRIADHVSEHDRCPAETHLRFAAPLVPALASEADEGNGTYRWQVQRTTELVAERAGWPLDRLSLVFESPPPADRRQEPSHPPGGMEGTEGGDLLICQLPFPVETAPTGAEVGVCSPMHTYAPFISCLKNIVLHGPKPVSSNKAGRAPLLRPRSDATYCAGEPASLVMIGASVASSLQSGRGPGLRYTTSDAFSRTKRSRKTLRATLKWIRDDTPAYEAFIWSTCQRIELYAWLPEASDPAEYDDLVGRIRQVLYGSEPDGFEVNVLRGTEARHHLLRTACGLNSDLPGDRDVTAQLETASRMARSSGTLGPRATRMVDDALAVAGDVHARTTWGRFSAGYCAAALARIAEEEPRPLHELHHVVIGGSTTSRSVLTALAERHGVPHGQMTAVYRDHHGQMKQLRCAVGCGTRLRVQSYWDERVLQSIAAADFVYLGIDQQDPVIDVDLLHELRDFRARPLTIIDFNSFGSIEGTPPPDGVTVWSSERLDQALLAHAATTASRVGFLEALADAEQWISLHLASTAPALAVASAEGD